ncbi:meprin A subunit beta isoform X2 [Dicentrarchus labrax]|uniref:Metalloendopeptidase n=2 Tax=Dicentrarchus labrax TaxID=13489 RepID=A0A8C4D7I8_DICLA|nr:meprin A subunit beta isoform X2 [Dicentrarchus labrax]XP_051261227.1 meprin A subunit beta isoform X2 [Dicentrarchus labrax]
MKGLIFLVVHLAVSSALSVKTNGSDLVNIGEDKDITDVNKGLLHDDILMPTQRSAINDRDILWTSPVPYVLGKDLEMNAKGVILKAHDQFRLKSCIDFKPRDSEEYYISVTKLNGCFSYIGQVMNNGQNLSIGTNCDHIATVEHEFLHALGFYHEQSRYDRDDYLTIAFENIKEGREHNFRKVSKEESTTNGVQYDYWSVMHYSKNAFSNGNGSTIITKDPKFEDVIGQRLEVSPSDVLELNRLYKCSSTIAFQMHCSFSNGTMCQMNRCSQSVISWEMVTKAYGGPNFDHTNLPSGNGDHHGQDDGYFMHASTTSGQKGDSAWLETQRMTAKRECHIQCLQFYFYHSGNGSDELNIWIREFEDEWDSTGTLRLMEQITGPPTSHWQVKHVSLNATKHFQVEFEIRKGAGNSSGSFSIDDINLSETECPHVTMQINDFENVWNTSEYGTTLYSQRQYSSGGYAYAVGTVLFNTHFGLFVQLLSGKYDDKLEWPLPQRQVTFQMLDQNPNIQLQMSKQRSITSDQQVRSDGTFLWDNPREIGTPYVDENNETIYAGPLIGRTFFATAEELKVRDFLKGGSAVFVFRFEDLTPLVNGSALPCPKVGQVKVTSPKDVDKGPCSSQILTTTLPPPKTTDNSIFGFCPGLVSSPVLTLMLALMLLIP